MKKFYEKLSNRILEVLNYPELERCTELAVLFDRCNIRELQEIFPAIIYSIFGVGTGNLGWGLRTITKENAPQNFDILLNFFAPTGPMFQLCYRLLNDATKFDVPLNQIPHKLCEMVQSGQYSIFYADLVNIDPFRRQVSSLSLNAFDYYMLHFVVHATLPLHKMYPAALQVHNERTKTVYFFLTAEYLCMFLPSQPDAVVMPTNICASVKVPQPVSVQPMQPKRSPKYLKIPNVSMYGAGNDNTTQINHNAESPRTHAWRTESVLYFFIDIWLRYDADETRELPSSEFIRVIRILIKQTHSFANAAHLDQTSSAALRKLAQPMMRNRFYPFIKSIIGRWPLDSSLSVVLELWLSYIQPWRYSFEWQNSSACDMDVPINSRFNMFIIENLVIYTQVFVHILPRFARLDYTSLRNALMLHRLVKVFSQPSLSNKLFQAEQAFAGNSLNFDSPQKQSTIANNSSGSLHEWDNFYQNDVYTPMFGPTTSNNIEQFIRTVYISRMYVIQEINAIREESIERRKSAGLLRSFLANIFEGCSLEQQKLRDMKKIPDILELAARSLSQMFHVDISNISVDKIEPPSQNSTPLNISSCNNSANLDISRLSPTQMMNNLANMKIAIDPALIPIQSYECAFLVRLLNRICVRINEEWGDQIQMYWNRSDIMGKLARQILYGPMTAQWFDKPCGVSTLCEEQLPARICLRCLASYRSLGMIALSLFYGYFVWGTPITGLLMMSVMCFTYVFVIALIS